MIKKRRRVEWTRLDNASKIFPATANVRDTKVFRMFCELNEAVNADTLQQALDQTLLSFPMYKSVLRRGVFWYYFESSQLEAKVEHEQSSIYSPLYIKGERLLAFRVFYHGKRINTETFHALSDGTGAFWFMQTLVYNYLMLLYPEQYADNPPELGVDASMTQRMDDSFDRHFKYRSGTNEVQRVPQTIEDAVVADDISGAGGTGTTGSSADPKATAKLTRAKQKALKRHAYLIRGERNELGLTSLIEGILSAQAVLELARSYNTTLTVFITAVYMQAMYEDMPYRKKPRPISIDVPVNLRQFYPSETARNFFSVINVRHLRDDQSVVPTLEELIDYIQQSFKEELTEERLMNRVVSFMKLERNPVVRVVPTSMKDIILRFFHYLSDLNSSGSISNMARVKMPDEMMPHINHFGVSTSARRPSICACSTGDRLFIAFSSPINNQEVTRRFFQFFTKRGIAVTISSNISVLPSHENLMKPQLTGIVSSSEVAGQGRLPLVAKEDQDRIIESQKSKGDE